MALGLKLISESQCDEAGASLTIMAGAHSSVEDATLDRQLRSFKTVKINLSRFSREGLTAVGDEPTT